MILIGARGDSVEEECVFAESEAGSLFATAAALLVATCRRFYEIETVKNTGRELPGK